MKHAFRTLQRTILQAVPTILAIVVIDFFLLKLAPGDMADVVAGEAGSATEETVTALRVHFGLDQPVLNQLLAYLHNLVHFNLGYSHLYGMPVGTLIGERLPRSLLLIGSALAVAIAVGGLLGVLMASFAGRMTDRALSILALLFYSVPSFWIGLMMIVLFSVWLGWLPSGGYETIGAGYTGFDRWLDIARHTVLPTAALAIFFIAIYARLIRASMLEVRDQDFVRTAAAKGLTPVKVTLRHTLRNALLPVTTVIGMHAGILLGGAVVIETVFSWPGIGRLAFEAVLKRDYTVLLGILLLSAILVIVTNVIVDLLHAWLDPRIEAR